MQIKPILLHQFNQVVHLQLSNLDTTLAAFHSQILPMVFEISSTYYVLSSISIVNHYLLYNEYKLLLPNTKCLNNYTIIFYKLQLILYLRKGPGVL